MDKERDFWVVLFTGPNAECSEAAPGEGVPFKVDLQHLSRETVFEEDQGLEVFTTEELALTHGWHVEDQAGGDWRMFAPLRLTQAQIRELVFKGDPHGVCAVDSTDGEGLVIGVNGLHLV